MTTRRQILVGAAATLALAEGVLAQGTPAPAPAAPAPDTPFGVSYIEVAVSDRRAARKLLKAYKDAAQKGAGLVWFEAYERIGFRNHFAIVEQWATMKARVDNATSAAGKAYRDGVKPMLITAYDERPHFALNVGPKVAKPGAIYVVTHVDIIPPRRDVGVGNTKAVADQGRAARGNLRYDALVQANRPNHMTLAESWTSRAAQDAHAAAPHMRAYREGLLPMTGSLFDERLYTLV